MSAQGEYRSIRGISLPPRGWPLATLLMLYIVPGLVGHDPWKVEDAAAFGVVYDMLQRGNWLTPEIAGQTYLHAPLAYWIAAVCGKAFSWAMPLHDAARLSSGLITFLTLGFAHLAARALHGREFAVAAPLLLAGSIGFLVHAHELQPMLLTLAAHFAAYWGLALLDRRPWIAAEILGLALGASLLGNGLVSTALLFPLVALALALSHNWRTSILALLAALGIATCVAMLWLLPLGIHAPSTLDQWWQFETSQFGRQNQPLKTATEYLGILPWYAWPAMPLAGWTLWSRRRTLGAPTLLLPLFGFFSILLGLSVSQDARSAPALLLLPPLVLLAVPGLPTLRRGAANAMDWFGVMTFSLFAALIWIGWSAMVFGWPERLARQVVRLEPGFVGSFDLAPFALALAATLIWIGMIASSPRSPFRGMTHWVAGVTLFWVLATSLWLPWIDYGKTYRPLAASLAAALPSERACLAGVGLGDAQRASLEYFSGIVTVPGNSVSGQHCNWLLTQGTRRSDDHAPGEGWEVVWQGNRPGDRSEKFRLYRRNTSAPE